MGSKRLPYGSLNPQIAQRFARRMPSTECVPTHSHLLAISPVGKMMQMSLQGVYTP
jgi:hypothetical protein